MVDPMGKYWRQPQRDNILLSKTHCKLSKKYFDALPEYSTSYPSGVYEGKMWKRKMWKRKQGEWILMWYGKGDKPNTCSYNGREIIIDESQLK